MKAVEDELNKSIKRHLESGKYFSDLEVQVNTSGEWCRVTSGVTQRFQKQFSISCWWYAFP